MITHINIPIWSLCFLFIQISVVWPFLCFSFSPNGQILMKICQGTTPRWYNRRFLKIVFLLYFWPQTTNRQGIVLFFFFGKWKKQSIPIFLVRKNPPIQRYFYFSNFQILGSHRDFLRKWACVISLSMGLPSTNYLILHVTKWKNGEKKSKRSEKFARNPKSNREKSTKKWFFFKFPTAKQKICSQIYFSFFFFRVFFCSALNSIPLIKAPGSGGV